MLAEGSPEKFIGKEMQNFGFRSGTIGAAAGKMDRTSGTSMLSATLAYIYTQGLEILEIRDILGNN